MVFRFLFVLVCCNMMWPGFSQTTLLDAGWRFHRGGAQGAEAPAFNDTQWRQVDLPHDWSIEDIPGTASPFHPDAVSQVSGGFTVGGTGWYRKSFTVPKDQIGKRIILQFDGIYMNADCWVNGELMGNHPYGYTSFTYDITDKIIAGENNCIAVQVKNEGQTSRWYSGSGIYRHVWLKMLDPLHINQWGVSVTTPEVSASAATINIATGFTNENKTGSRTSRLVTSIYDPQGKEVGTASNQQDIANGTIGRFGQTITIAAPQRWDIDKPALYKAVTSLFEGDSLTDQSTTIFGIRTISFDAVTGFQLNGRPLKLKGGCVHHDNGPLGAKAFDRAEERRVQLLKASGFNAVRCSHNPPSPAFLDACDRLGMLVMDEAFDMWRLGNNPGDYHLYFDDWWQRDLESMVMRDRNHPSVILWSIGNEIRDMETAPVIAIAKMLAGAIRKLDPSRPVTAAVNGLSPQKDAFFATLDVGGYNYAANGDHQSPGFYVTDHQRIPGRVMLGTESYASESFDAWMGVLDDPWVTGDFVWTAFDYIGEASIGWRGYWQESNFYPWNLAYCGDLDICGWKRPQSYYRDALWKPNQVSVFVKPPSPSFPVNPNKQSWSRWEWADLVEDWTWPGNEGKPMEVTVYSSCQQVELFLNGKSLGKKKTDRSNRFTALWTVPYKPGELKVLGYQGPKVVATSLLKTGGAASSLKLTADRSQLKADGQDLSYITVELVDKTGNRNPKADSLVRFEIDGPATIVGVGNANPVSTESYQLPQRTAWRGRCLVIVRSQATAGQITLRATSPGLDSAQIALTAVK